MINYDGRRFRATHHDPGHEPGSAVYRQQGDLVWADFEGGRVRRGAMAGLVDEKGTVDFAYTMVLDTGEVISGHSTNTPEFLPDGRIRLHEVWERYGDFADKGVSTIVEVAEAAEVAGVTE